MLPAARNRLPQEYFRGVSDVEDPVHRRPSVRNGCQSASAIGLNRVCGREGCAESAAGSIWRVDDTVQVAGTVRREKARTGARQWRELRWAHIQHISSKERRVLKRASQLRFQRSNSHYSRLADGCVEDKSFAGTDE